MITHVPDKLMWPSQIQGMEKWTPSLSHIAKEREYRQRSVIAANFQLTTAYVCQENYWGKFPALDSEKPEYPGGTTHLLSDINQVALPP